MTPKYIEEIITNLENEHMPIHNEIFAIPFNSYVVADLEGIKLYSSDALKRKFIKTISKTKKSAPASAKIAEMVKNDKVIPCWITKNLMTFAFFKIFIHDFGSTGILGAYFPSLDKIFIIMDNNISILGYAPNKVIANVLLHETMHMAAKHMKNGFVTLFSDELTRYYSAMFKEIFNIKTNIDKESKQIVDFIWKNFEIKNDLNYSKFKAASKIYADLLDTKFAIKTNFEHEVFKNTVEDYITFLTLYFKDINSFIRSIRQYRHIFRAMYSGYKIGLGNENRISTCIQELMYPSEVIAIYQELISGGYSKRYTAINAIK